MPTLDLTPEPLDIIAKRGATWDFSLLWLDDADQPIDNTGWDFTMQLRVEYAETPTLILSTSDGTITAAGSTGYIEFLVPSASTAIPTQRYVFGLLCDTGSAVRPVSDGTVTVED